MKTINSFRSKLLALTLAIMASVSSFAYDFQVNGLNYNITSSVDPYTVEVTKNISDNGNNYDGYTSITIPKKVKYNNISYQVTGIGKEAFLYSFVSSFEIPNTVKYIAESAFGGSFELTSIEIPNSVTDIGIAAFSSSDKLTSVILGDGVTTIGPLAFMGCRALQTINIPESVTTISALAFYDCPKIIDITLSNSLIEIGDQAFSYTNITSIELPQSVTILGLNPFSYIPSLTKLSVKKGHPLFNSDPNSNAIIETATNTLVAGCRYSIVPNTITVVGKAAFMGCKGRTELSLPNSVKTINDSAYFDCIDLKSIDIPNSVTTIGSEAFSWCTSATSLTIGENVNSIGGRAFWGCEKIKTVTCNAIVVPNLGEDVFPCQFGGNIYDATLYVPAESVEAYKNADQWKDFGQILPIEQTPEDLFPTLWGLERTDVEGTTMGYDDPYHMSFSKYTPTLVDGIWYLFDGRNYFREANNQILWYAPYLNTVDAVLYDWTLQVGDTLPIYSNPFHKDNNRGSLFRVTDVSTITLLDGKEYKKWTFSGGFEVVEGIGAINKGFGHYYCLLHTTHPAVYTGWKPICISKNGQLLYQMDEIKMISNELKCMCELTPSYKDQWCNTWNTIDFDGMRFEETAETWQYKLANDTIINNQKYTIVNRYWTADRNNTKQYVAAVRFTDDRKVYIYYDNAEYLLYDFNVQEGDELEVFAGINNYTSEIKTYKCTVTGVEQYACVGCPAAITLEVHNHPNDFREFYRQTQWIEGVGDINGFLNGINHYVEVDGGYTYCLLCAYHDEEQVYTTDNEKLASYNCEYNAGYEYSSPTLAGLQRTMCREYIGYEGRNETWMTETEKEVLINDKFYRKWDKWLLREENDRIYVYSNKQDILLYDFTLEVGDSLRTLILHPDLGIIDVPIGTIYPIDTLIVTNISTVTLLDGKEYRKWSFNNGEFEYVKGIGCLDGNFLALAKDVVNGDYINSHLVCVSKNGKLLYQMDDAEMERLGTECLCEIETSYKSQWCDTWNVLELKYRYSSYTTKEDFETWRYYLAQDTIINNYTYTAVTRQTTKVSEGVYPFTIPEPEYVAAVRFTDDRKVYIYYDNTEYLLYDFNVQPGDELTVFAGINHYHSHHTNTIRVDEVERYPGIYPFGTEISLSVFPDFSGDERPACFGVTKWVEGVGDLCGFITGADCGLSEYQTALLCAYKDGYTEYTTEYEEYAEYGCEYNSGENKEYILTLPGLQRTGCTKTIGENENGTVWGSRSYLMQEIETATIDGKQYLLFGIDNNYDKLYLKLWLREENNKILLYSTAQKKDLVLYDFTLNVGDSLPRLYVDYDLSSVVDYDNDEWGLSPLVVTEVSTITLLDGKEYKKWTFDNGMQYVEGIGSFGTCYAHNDFYQLIANAPLSSDVYSQYLVCVSKNGKLLYQMDDAEMERLGAECLCDYNSGPKRDNAKDGQIGGRPTPTQWNMLEMELRKMENGISILHAETFSYTLEDISQQVNSRTYFQLARQSTKDTATTKSVVGALHFGKEEDNRVYFLRDGVEYVLYDFTVEPGDTVEIFAGINNYPQETTYTHVVTSKDTLENGACRMMLEVVFPEETSTAENVEKVWLAGLGSVDGIVHNAAKRTSDVHAAPARSASSETQTSVMLCAWREDSCLYTTDHPDYDTFGCVYNQDPTSVENPTSPSSYQKLLRDGQLLIIHNDKIYNVLGLDIGKSSIKIVESLTNN